MSVEIFSCMPSLESFLFYFILLSYNVSSLLQITVADLPGLIEDAHLNKGMGHRFLRHTERTNAIALVVDINGFQLKSTHPYRSPIETIILLLRELLLYQNLLLERPLLLVLNKMDSDRAHEKRIKILNDLLHVKDHPLLKDIDCAEELTFAMATLCENNFQNVFSLSSTEGTGADLLKQALYTKVARIIFDVNTDNDKLEQ